MCDQGEIVSVVKVPPLHILMIHLLADNHALTAGRAGLVLVLGLRGALGVGGGVASGATTVELDAGAGAGDAVALACAAGRGRGDRAWGAAVAAAGAERWDIRVGIGVAVAVGLVAEVCSAELGGKGLDGWVRELLLGDLASGMGLGWSWALDLRGIERAALGDLSSAGAACMARGLGCSLNGGGLGSWDVEDVELAASGWLGDGLAGWVVRDVVAVDDVVVPVSLALLQCGAWEAEGTLPATSLLGILGEWELPVVVVPGADEMHGLAVVGGAEREVKLDRCHFELIVFGLKRLLVILLFGSV